MWPFGARKREQLKARADAYEQFKAEIGASRRKPTPPTQIFQSSGYRWTEAIQGVNGGSLWHGERRWQHESGVGEVYDTRALPVTSGYVLGETCMRESVIGSEPCSGDGR